MLQPSPPFFLVRGPSRTGSAADAVWTASVKFRQNQDPAPQWAMQELFVAPAGDGLLAPGTMFGFCIVQTLQITIGGLTLNFDRIDAANTVHVPMLLQANPADWMVQDDEIDQVPHCLCLAGQIPVALLEPHSNNPDWTKKFAGLIQSADGLTATSSGLWISGKPLLPWDAAALPNSANFHVMVPQPNGGAADQTLLVQLDCDTLTAASLADFVGSFSALNGALATGGNWAKLELSNPSTVPVFSWTIPSNRLQLGPGEMSLVLFGGEPGVNQTPQTFAVGSISPVFTRASDGSVIVKLVPDHTSPSKAVYSGNAAAESFVLQNCAAGYDSLTAASVLRQQIGLPDPLVKPVPNALWGCLALEDGWAQLPFLNVSESIYAAAFPPPDIAHPAPAVILAGAAAYGNDNQPPASEQTWTVVLSGGSGLEGTWTLKPVGGKMTVTAATATLYDPNLELNGFVFLGNEPPTAADALPSLTNWLAAVTMIPLRSQHPADLTPSPWRFVFSKLKFTRQADPFAPVLADWSCTVEATPALDILVATGFFPKLADELKDPPLVWRRHPNLPAVQSLPLTQSLNPPNYPSPSRQFAPFQIGLDGVKPKGWTFTNGATNAASAWPRFSGTVTPILVPAMASLSTPGLSFDPAGAPIPSTQFLGVQYHHGLPYLDEIYALSQLTKPGAPSNAAAQPLPPLDRPSYQPLWDQLTEKAFFAQAEGDAALSVTGAQTTVSGLVEPLTWPVTPAWDESAYPGTLTLADTNGGPALKLSADSALEGFTGGFNVQGSTSIARVAASPTFQVIAGSMAAQGTGGKVRDQRGFVRQSTTAPLPATLDTVLTSPDGQDWILRSSLDALPLVAGNAAWSFWFRDLPLKPADGAFVRDHTRSTAARGVNDPAALSPQWVHLAGYEWRLGAGTASPSLPLLGFQFVPLTLEKVEFAGASVHAVEVIGRLLLPGASPDLEVNRANAALLRFEAKPGLVLVSVSAAGIDPDRDPKRIVDDSGPAGEWPLDPAGDTARLFWDQLALVGNKIQVTKGTLEFFYWRKRWSTPIDFSTTPAVAQITADGPARLDRVELTLDPASGVKPKLDAYFVYQFGDPARSFIQVNQTQSLLDSTVTTTVALANSGGTILALNGGASSLLGSVQAQWSGLAKAQAASDWQLLPGMHLHATQPITGFGAMMFIVNGFDPTNAGAPPPLVVQSAFSESIIRCEWGEMLQEPAATQTVPRLRFFNSSAGCIVAGFTTVFDVAGWTETLLLNGLLEIKSLISWPRLEQPLTQTPGHEDFAVSVPVARLPLHHARHTMRVLFDQQLVPMDHLVAGPAAAHQLFTFADKQGWQFLAVTEHQLADVQMNPQSPLDPGAVLKDRRWTTLQPVSLLTPSSFSNFLTGLKGKTTLTHDTDGLNLGSFGDLSYLFGGQLLNALQGALAPLKDTLIVEASAAHWIRLKSSTLSGFSPLMFLPGLTPTGALTSLSDYSPSADPTQPEWLMAVVPFLGRLQPARLDTTGGDLQVDPILQIGPARSSNTALPTLALLLASWDDANDFPLRVSPFELANDPAVFHPRRYYRLDPASVAASWLRVTTPPAEAPANKLTSILATQPTDGPSRLGRPAALARDYGSLRTPVLLLEPFATPPLIANLQYRLFFAGLTLLSATFANSGPKGPTYYPAATVLPDGDPTPVSLALSPYLGFSRRFPLLTNASAIPVLESGELIGTQPSGQAGVLATQLWIADPLAPATIDVTVWAKANIQRTAPDSRIALLRVREVQNAAFSTGEKTVTVAYLFQLLAPAVQDQVARVNHPVRTQLQRLRFAEGQYGGPRTPALMRDFEAAPPQVRDVQPLRYERRPDPSKADLWPWGLSALRLSIRSMESSSVSAGLTAAAQNSSTFWWQAVAHGVQFNAGQAAALQLPPLFRAPAIGSLLPALPDLKLPRASLLAEAPDEPWQPMLPGSLDWLVDGARPGAGFIFRAQVLRQTGDVVDASGAIPVQHRMPRPVPLRANLPARPDIALRTWAHYFAPQQLVLANVNPSDTAFYAPLPKDLQGKPEQRKLTLTAPADATILSNWDTKLVFQYVDLKGGPTPPAANTWKMEVILESQGAVFQFADPVVTATTITYTPDPAVAANLATNLGRLSHGDQLTVTVRLEYVPTEIKNYKQSLVFPLRIARPAVFPLPLQPVFAVFEDPEYNRRLISNTVSGEGVWVEPAVPPVPHRIRLALDRREYNAGSRVFAVYVDFASSKLASAFLRVSVIRQDGVEYVLGPTPPPTESELQSFSIADLFQPVNLKPVPGDILSFTLLQDSTLIVAVQAVIVAEPVTPTPDAAYALLRQIGTAVDCGLFAWSPGATRVELLNPSDLLGQTVRRRAIFNWTVTNRANTGAAYAIQKIASNGSTHTIATEEWQSTSETP